MKVGRIKDPLDKASYFGITPPTFIPPFEAPEGSPPWGERFGADVGYFPHPVAVHIKK